MTDIKERQELEDEIKRLDIKLVVYAENRDITDEYYRCIYLQRNAMILDYSRAYGTKALERLRPMLDENREEFIARARELEVAAGIKDTYEVEIKKPRINHRGLTH